MKRPALIIALIVFGSGTAVWSVRQTSLRDTHSSSQTLEQQILQRQQEIAAAQEEQAVLQRRIVAARQDEEHVSSEVAQTDQQLTEVSPDALYSKPPTQLPEWKPDSPYVWMPKEALPKFPVEVFDNAGRMDPRVASVLTLDEATLKSLNTTLNRLVVSYQEKEAALAEFTENHLSGIAGQKGDKLSLVVKPLPEEGRQLKQQFESTVNQLLGGQRGQLVQQGASSWLDSTFSHFGAEPKTISLIRHPNGGYNVSVKSGGSWISTGGPDARSIEYQIPAHLRSRFSSLLQPKAADRPTAASR
jgi:hypothetical protein